MNDECRGCIHLTYEASVCHCAKGWPPRPCKDRALRKDRKCQYCNRKSVWNIGEDEIPVCAKHSSIYLRTEGRMDADLDDLPDDPEPDTPWEDK